MLQQDYNYPLFTTATVGELQQQLEALESEYEPDDSNEAFRILKRLQELSDAGKGLRMDTKYGLGSYWTHTKTGVRVRFDGDVGSTGVQWKSINTFWFEME
jgi:hypothetical protein